jgi:AraC-like DNA-binding protein
LKEHVISQRTGVGICGTVLQVCDLPVWRFVVDAPTLVLVTRGTKILRTVGETRQIEAGGAVVLSSGVVLDVMNLVDDEGRYEARWLAWDDEVLERQAQSSSKGQSKSAYQILVPTQEFLASAKAAVHGIAQESDVPLEIAIHRASEVLQWVEHLAGHLPSTGTHKLRDRLRRLLQLDLTRCWTAELAARELGMSEPTLRRRLGAEGFGFSSILSDVRMLQGMQLLQSTSLSVTQVALEVGYTSPSRFAVRFRERFGFPPGTLRGYHRHQSELQAAE